MPTTYIRADRTSQGALAARGIDIVAWLMTTTSENI
jgi:hypothetical protein